MNSAPFHVANLLTFANRSLDDADIGDDAAKRVVLAVEHEGLKRILRPPLWRWDAFDDRLKDIIDIQALLRAHPQRGVRVETENRLNLLEDFVDPSDRQVDFVHDRNDLEIHLDGGISV